MQRDAISLIELASYDNLVLAVWKAARGKHGRRSVARFLEHLDDRLAKLSARILDRRAPVGRFRRFLIHDPKRRIITACCFEDRVLHHAILNLAEARFERMLVGSTYACRRGKGVHRAVLAVQDNLRRWPWFAQVDVEAFFPSVDHAMLKALLARRFKGVEFLALLGRIIDAGAVTPGRGLPIGSLTSQHFANAYLDYADRLLLGHPAVHAHVRYMDDIVWWCSTHDDVMRSLEILRRSLREGLGLTLKPKVRVARSGQGIRFCGFRVRTGVVLASSRKLSRFRRGLQRVRQAREQGWAQEGVEQRVLDGLLATLAGAETSAFRRRLLRDLPLDDGCADVCE